MSNTVWSAEKGWHDGPTVDVRVDDVGRVKSYRSVPMASTGAFAAAARVVEREWGDGYRIGFAGTAFSVLGETQYVFQVCASDGSRFLVWADRWENVGTYDETAEARVALALDVEVS